VAVSEIAPRRHADDLGGSTGKQPAEKAPAKKRAANKHAPAKKATAKKQAPAKKHAAKKHAPAKEQPAEKAPTKKHAGTKRPAKKKAPKGTKSAATAAGTAQRSTRHRRPGANKAKPTMALAAAPTDPLAILGLPDPFTATQLRQAWRRYAARHHPDQGGDAATFTRGRNAYEALLNRGSD
jgi:hypothetical protein